MAQKKIKKTTTTVSTLGETVASGSTTKKSGKVSESKKTTTTTSANGKKTKKNVAKSKKKKSRDWSDSIVEFFDTSLSEVSAIAEPEFDDIAPKGEPKGKKTTSKLDKSKPATIKKENASRASRHSRGSQGGSKLTKEERNKPQGEKQIMDKRKLTRQRSQKMPRKFNSSFTMKSSNSLPFKITSQAPPQSKETSKKPTKEDETDDCENIEISRRSATSATFEMESDDEGFVPSLGNEKN